MSAADKQRYLNAMHGVQTAVAAGIELGDEDASPKHLRTGVNAAMVSHLAVANLLIEKNVITVDEYEKAQADAAELELAGYQALNAERLPGVKFR